MGRKSPFPSARTGEYLAASRKFTVTDRLSSDCSRGKAVKVMTGANCPGHQTPLNDNGSGAALSIAPASGTMEDVKERIWEAQQRDSPDPMPDLRPALPGFSAYPGYDSGAHLRTALGTFTRNSP